MSVQKAATDAATPLPSPALTESLFAWLDHISALKGAAAATIEAYRRDVAGYLGFLSAHLAGQWAAPGWPR